MAQNFLSHAIIPRYVRKTSLCQERTPAYRLEIRCTSTELQLPYQCLFPHSMPYSCSGHSQTIATSHCRQPKSCAVAPLVFPKPQLYFLFCATYNIVVLHNIDVSYHVCMTYYAIQHAVGNPVNTILGISK